MAKFSPTRTLIHFTIICAFIGSAFLVWEVGTIHLFLFRFAFVFLVGLFILNLMHTGVIRLTHIRTREYLWFLFFWLAYAVLSLGWAACTEDAVRNILFLATGVGLTFFVVYYFRGIGDYSKAFHIWLAVLLFMMGLGLWNVITGDHLSGSKLVNAPDYRRFVPTAVYHNQNNYATYLAISFAFVISYIRYAKTRCAVLSGLCFLLFPLLYLLVATGSRANYVAVIVGVIFWLALFVGWKTRVRIGLAGVLCVLVALALFPGAAGNTIGAVQSGLGSLFTGLQQYDSSAGGSVNVRLNLIANAFIFAKNTVLFGVGAGNADYHMAFYSVYDTGSITNVHNWWMELLANYGLFVFTGYLLFYGGVLFNLYKRYKLLVDPRERMVCEALIIGLIIFAVGSSSPSSVMAFNPQWILLALSLGFLNYLRVSAPPFPKRVKRK